jgi:hypothetical protein
VKVHQQGLVRAGGRARAGAEADRLDPPDGLVDVALEVAWNRFGAALAQRVELLLAAGHRAHLVAVLHQLVEQMPSRAAGGTDHQDLHVELLPVGFRTGRLRV